MKRQGGFTLIEMIVVIVILGILAVTAAPKFLSLEKEAKIGTLRGVEAAIVSSASMAHGVLLLNPSSKEFTNTHEYPTADADGIGKLVSVSDDLTAKELADVGYIWGYNDTCYVGYKAPAEAGSEPTYPSDTTGC
ncbi:prepilin-type N-terminal cleavage/methylation domain-containing protein [Grimontia hollisae]|uniref:PilD-dependent protein pddA n=1 Tax=Grimontia hollisae TaxID=673 RepID=A0A377HJB0_GRIHO|nr:type II secretion system protein [Grimontia hollisae]STO56328.1 PilD-dependent protein pddA [Grimontia hollisae]